MKRRYDLPLLFLTLTLVAFGLAMVYSASAFIAAEQYRNPMHHVTRQGIAAEKLVGVCVDRSPFTVSQGRRRWVSGLPTVLPSLLLPHPS